MNTGKYQKETETTKLIAAPSVTFRKLKAGWERSFSRATLLSSMALPLQLGVAGQREAGRPA